MLHYEGKVMAPRKKQNGLIPAVAYYRMSSNKQETSIPEQREAVERYAGEHGYRIIRDYCDEGISGDATSKRVEFQRMHHAACNGRDFRSILCWDQSRFGRFDSVEAGYWIHPIRQAGIRLATVCDGLVDWNSFSGRVVNMLHTEGKHQFLRDLSANVTRGLLAKARRGEWTQGQPPIGYRVDENDRLILGPPDEIEIINRIFREYLAGGSLGSVTVGINADGILSPTGNRWNRWTVSRILKRRLYIGAFVSNADPRGKYSQVRGGRVQRVTGDTQIRVSDAEVGIPTSDEIFIPDNHPAIISHEVFDAVQRRLSQQRVNHGDFSPSPDRYALTGLLWCGKCDQRMQGRCQGGYQFYMCGGAGRGLCTQNSVRQDKLLGELFGAVHQHLADPARLERFK